MGRSRLFGQHDDNSKIRQKASEVRKSNLKHFGGEEDRVRDAHGKIPPNKGKVSGAGCYGKITFDELDFREVFGSVSINAPKQPLSRHRGPSQLSRPCQNLILILNRCLIMQGNLALSMKELTEWLTEFIMSSGALTCYTYKQDLKLGTGLLMTTY